MKTKKKILFITAYYPPHPGGVEKYVHNIAKQLSQKFDWEVVIVTSALPNQSKVETNDGLKIYKLSYQLKLSNSPLSLRWYGQLKEIIKTEKPDIVNVQLPVPGLSDLAGRAAGKTPVVVTYHMGTMKKESSPLNFIIWLYEHIALPPLLARSKKLIGASDFVSQEFLHEYKDKTHTITPGVNSKLFYPAVSLVTKPNILFVGSLNQAESHKGLQYLLTACQTLQKTMKNIHLTIVGEGDWMDKFKLQANDLGIDKNVEFRGRLEGTELASVFRSAAVFALPSTIESFGIVITEAMASGLPVVASHVGGIPSVVEDNVTGLLVPPRDEKALSDALKRILDNPKLAKKMGEAGKAKALAEYDWTRQAKRTDKLLREALKQGS